MLHWLTVNYRIQFKILLFVYKALNGIAPPYISELVELKQASRYNLRNSDDTLLLNSPSFKSRITLGDYGGPNQSKPFVYLYFVDVTYHLIFKPIEFISETFDFISETFDFISQIFDFISATFELISETFDLIFETFELISETFEYIS